MWSFFYGLLFVSVCFMTFLQMEAVKEVLSPSLSLSLSLSLSRPLCLSLSLCVSCCPGGSYIIHSQTLKM